MRTIITFLFCLFALSAFCQNKSYDYCYSGYKGSYVYSITDKKAYPILNGIVASDLCISPDGMKVAYTLNLKDGGRTIAILDLNTKQKTILNTNSNHCYGPVWSPDGNFIAYNVFNYQTSKWSVALIGTTQGSVSRVLTNKISESYMPTWTSDSKSVVVQDMNNIYVFDLAGDIVTTYKISDLNKDWEPNSADKYILTNDNKIIFSSEENDYVGPADDPPTAVFVYDISNRSTLRLSPKGCYAWDVAVKGDKVFFTIVKFKSMIQNIYVTSLDGKGLNILFPNAHDISLKN